MYNNGQSYKGIAQAFGVDRSVITSNVNLLLTQGKIIQRMHPKYMTYNYVINLILMEKGYNYISASHLNTRISHTNIKKHFNNFKNWNISRNEDISDRVKNETLTNTYNEVNNLIKSHPDVPKKLPGCGQRLHASLMLR